VLGGFVWASSDFANVGGMDLMENAALGAYVFLFLALYFTGWPSTLRSKARLRAAPPGPRTEGGSTP